MIRFLFSLFLFLLVLASNAQNLIPNPSGEELLECPETLDAIESSVLEWQAFRGSPDYFNNCTSNDLLGWNNVIGSQEPRTGTGYFGTITFNTAANNTREYFGVEIIEPLEIGQTYFVTFYVSLAYSLNLANLATNNISCLLMVNNYLNPQEEGPCLNSAIYNTPFLISDTIGWTQIEFSFEADSAYQYIAFGNFFDDGNTDTLPIIAEQKYDAQGYYFYDDFCLSTNPDSCEYKSVNIDEAQNAMLRVFPNPSSRNLKFISNQKINTIQVFNFLGLKVIDENHSSFQTEINHSLVPGHYLVLVSTNNGITIKKRIIITP